MDCAQAAEYIELNALQALDAKQSRALQQHLAACKTCRVQSEQLALRLEHFRRDLRLPDLASPVLQQLRRRIRREIQTSRVKNGSRIRFLFLARAAAALVICAGLLYAWQTLRKKADEQAAGQSWTKTGIAAVAGNNTPYPLVTEKEIFALIDEPDGKHLVTLDRRTGAHLWKTAFPVCGVPCSDSRRVYVWNGTDASGLQLTALECKTGTKAWIANDRSLPRQINPSLVAVSGQKLCWSTAGNVVALDIHTGKRLWTRTLAQNESLSAPVVDSKRLYVASGETLYALKLESGTVCWQRNHEQRGSFLARPLVQCDAGLVVVGLGTTIGRGLLQCYRAENGEALWMRKTDTPRHLLACRGKIYVRGASVHAFDEQTGTPAWSVPMGGCSPLAMAANRLYVMEGLERKGIIALQADTGQRVWDNQQMSSCSGFVISGTTGYLVTQQGDLQAIGINS